LWILQNLFGLPFAHGGSATSLLVCPSWQVPKSIEFTFSNISGRQKNSGMSSLTSAVWVLHICHVAATELKSRSAWSSFPPCSTECRNVKGSILIRKYSTIPAVL